MITPMNGTSTSASRQRSSRDSTFGPVIGLFALYPQIELHRAQGTVTSSIQLASGKAVLREVP